MPSFKLTKTKAPSTPIMKRFLRDVFKPTMALGKRRREESDENLSQSPSPVRKPHQNCVALQNEDQDEDAVVITALQEVPFCCHADLLIMARDDLVRAAQVLNAKLPRALQIDILRSDMFIRNSIEVLVGIRANMDIPPAPKRDRSLRLNTSNSDASLKDSSTSRFFPPSLLSPMPLQTQGNTFLREPLANLAQLEALREEDEDSMDDDRPTKRRRMAPTSPSPVTTPTPPARFLGRSQSYRAAPPRGKLSTAGGSQDVFRSQSHRLPDRRSVELHRNATSGRRQAVTARSGSGVFTSTPNPRKPAPKKRKADLYDETDSSPSSSHSAVPTPIGTPMMATERAQRVLTWLEGTDDDSGEVVIGMRELGLGMSETSSESIVDVGL